MLIVSVAGYPNLEAPDCPGKPWHGSDPDVMWGNSANITGQPNTPAEVQMGAYLRRVWSTFAADPVNGLTQTFGWSTFSTNRNNDYAIGFGMNNSTAGSLVDVQDVDATCFSTFAGGAPNF